MTFQTRGTLKTSSGIRSAYSIRVSDEEKDVESVIAWNRDGSVCRCVVSEETKQSELFSYVNGIIFCDHGDRGHIQTLMKLPSFFIFLDGSQLTVHSLSSIDRRRGSPNTSRSRARRTPPTG